MNEPSTADAARGLRFADLLDVALRQRAPVPVTVRAVPQDTVWWQFDIWLGSDQTRRLYPADLLRGMAGPEATREADGIIAEWQAHLAHAAAEPPRVWLDDGRLAEAVRTATGEQATGAALFAVTLAWMGAHGTSVILTSSDEQAGWECAWIVGGRRYWEHGATPALAVYRTLMGGCEQAP